MDEQLRALAKSLDEFVKRNGLAALEIHYDKRYADEPWEIDVTFQDGPRVGEGRTAEEAALHVAVDF